MQPIFVNFLDLLPMAFDIYRVHSPIIGNIYATFDQNTPKGSLAITFTNLIQYLPHDFDQWP